MIYEETQSVETGEPCDRADSAPDILDFLTNRHSACDPSKPQSDLLPAIRHPSLSFSDGNLAILANGVYFLIHKGLLSRHSSPLADAIRGLELASPRLLENCAVLELDDSVDDLLFFLLAMYDGVSSLKYNTSDLNVVSGILRIATKYQVSHVRDDIVRGLSLSWPKSLAQWEIREANVTSPSGVYRPRTTIPHPISIINLARETNTPELLPSAFYDLSRSTASDIAKGFIQLKTGITEHLSDEDLMAALRGKEHTSRYLSTFIVNELESRDASPACIYRDNTNANLRRMCRSAFETITFEILRDVNGLVLHRSSDPLFAIADADLMQTRDEPLGRLDVAFRACEPCRMEFTIAADAAREDLWLKIPLWFGVNVDNWL